MNSIALSMFAEPAATPIQGTESPPPSGSLFGALVAAVAKGGALETESSTAALDNGDMAQSDSTGAVPPPFVVREWLAQTETPPSLPKGLISGLEKFQANEEDATAPEAPVPDSSEPADSELTESEANSVLQSGRGPARSANDAQPEGGESLLRGAERPKTPSETSNSAELPKAMAGEARHASEPNAPAAGRMSPIQYIPGAGWTAHSEADSELGKTADPAAVRTVSETIQPERPTIANTMRPGRTPTFTAPIQLPADASSAPKSLVGRTTDEASLSAVDVPKTPRAPENPKIAQAGTQSPSLGAVDPVSQFPINAQPNTPSSNSEGVAAPSQTANVSAATDGSADAPVRLAPSARNEQSPEMESLALHIAARSARGDSRFTIRLDPPELGRIEVNLSMNSHGHAQAVLAVEKPQTLDLLLRDASALERALKDAGLELGSNLSFSLKEEGRPTFTREDNQGSPGRTVEVVPSDKANALAGLNTPLLEQFYGSRTARLDITV
jgi:flagellar hook-length control protein FliK